MRGVKMLHAAVWLAILALMVLIGPMGAFCASLSIWLEGGEQEIHDLAILEQINFSGDQLHVVSAYWTNSYPLESIVRISFLDYPTDAGDSDEIANIIKAVCLFQNYPNPFNPETKIEFELPKGGMVNLRVYAVNGQLVRTLLEKDMPRGPHSVRWDGRDDSGRSVASGVYFYSLVASGVRESRKMILLR